MIYSHRPVEIQAKKPKRMLHIQVMLTVVIAITFVYIMQYYFMSLLFIPAFIIAALCTVAIMLIWTKQ
jgi:undecaprenyl pyrophosphate phosphatase UppP